MKLRLSAFSFLIFCFSLVAAPASHAQINGGMSGSFYNPDNDGTGLNVEILSDTFGIAYWYTYDLEGKQRWHLLLGDIEGRRMTGEMYTYEGMVFGDFDPASVSQHVFGNYAIEFSDCNNLTFQFSPSAVQPDGRFYPSGRLSMQRLSSPLGVAEQCDGGGVVAERSPVAGIYLGQVQSPGLPAQETLVLITENGSVAGVSENGMYFGLVSVVGPRFSGRISALAFAGFSFPDGDVFARVDLEGERVGSVLNFNYQVRSRNSGQVLENGTYRGQYLNLYELDFTQQTLAGSWRSELGYRFDIGADGRLSGSGPGGCRYFGTARPIDPRFNAATARLLPANCFDVDGTVELTLIQDEGALLVLASGDQFYFDIWRR